MVDTGLIEREGASLTDAPVPCSRACALAAVGALGLDQPAYSFRGASNWTPLRHRCQLQLDGQTLQFTAQCEGALISVQDEITQTQHEIERKGDCWFVDGVKTPAEILCRSPQITVFWGNGYEFECVDPLDRDRGDTANASTIVAPMPGLVREVLVAPGQEVHAEMPLAVLEAMKMEHVLRASRDGIVEQVLVSAGDQVEAGIALIALQADEPKEQGAGR